MTAHMHSPDDLLGGRYRVIEFVGEGGMQQVYRVNDILLGRHAALKTPKNASASKRFSRSAIVSARVKHANVAKTLDYFEDGASAYLVEEFIDGKDLGQVLKNFSVMDPLTVARIVHRLARGLAASHHAGVVHRDLKPSNVMSVGGDLMRELKITDFGIAKLAEAELADALEGEDEGSLTASQTAIGAIPYMAPEMIQSFKDAAKPADVWSLGAMAYELLTGKKPYGAGLSAVPKIVLARQPEIDLNRFKIQFRPTAEELAQLILKCMTKDPSSRPDADALVRDCERLCYPLTPLELGTVVTFDNGFWGFLSADVGAEVFFHVDSLPHQHRPKVGDRVAFARHAGGGRDRAFPVLPISASG
jgi:serine/threonine-protein kinase